MDIYMKKNIIRTITVIGYCLLVIAFASCSDDHTGSIDVSGSCLVEKFVLDGKYEGTINTEKRLVKVKRREERKQSLNVLFRVQRLEQPLALCAALLVHVLKVSLLQPAAIAQHHLYEIDSGGTRVHLTSEPAPHKLRQVA